MQSIAFEDMDTIHKKRVTSNVFETRTSTWEELKKTSDDALFHLKYLLQVYSETDGTNFSSDDVSVVGNYGSIPTWLH